MVLVLRAVKLKVKSARKRRKDTVNGDVLDELLVVPLGPKVAGVKHPGTPKEVGRGLVTAVEQRNVDALVIATKGDENLSIGVVDNKDAVSQERVGNTVRARLVENNGGDLGAGNLVPKLGKAVLAGALLQRVKHLERVVNRLGKALLQLILGELAVLRHSREVLGGVVDRLGAEHRLKRNVAAQLVLAVKPLAKSADPFDLLLLLLGLNDALGRGQVGGLDESAVSGLTRGRNSGKVDRLGLGLGLGLVDVAGRGGLLALNRRHLGLLGLRRVRQSLLQVGDNLLQLDKVALANLEVEGRVVLNHLTDFLVNALGSNNVVTHGRDLARDLNRHLVAVLVGALDVLQRSLEELDVVGDLRVGRLLVSNKLVEELLLLGNVVHDQEDQNLVDRLDLLAVDLGFGGLDDLLNGDTVLPSENRVSLNANSGVLSGLKDLDVLRGGLDLLGVLRHDAECGWCGWYGWCVFGVCSVWCDEWIVVY